MRPTSIASRVLEGPQGTLFGSGAESGAIRYITNAPKLDVTEGSVKAGYGITAHGDPNSNLTAVVNLPLIAGTMAVRAVIYNDSRGGYIDNVPATFTRKDTDIGIHYAGYATGCSIGTPVAQCAAGRHNGYGVPPGSPAINNNSIAGPGHQPGHLPGSARPRRCTNSTTTGTCCSRSHIRI
jgi:iron complex outermembrane receptor protein